MIGYLAAVLTTAAFVPQVVHTWRSKSTGDLSLGMLTSFTSGLLLWLVFGVALRSAPIIAANATTLTLNVLLIAMRLRYGRKSRAASVSSLRT